MNIARTVREALLSFELSELERLLEAIADQVYYQSGYNNICGGYAYAEAYGINDGEDYDEDADDWTDTIEIEVESGESDGSTTHCTKTCHRITRKVLGDKKMTLREKLGKVEEA
jgi:hypothetical protein